MYRRRREDIAFYRELARKCGGPVLELGAGTGRVTLPIASAGIEIFGVEKMQSMLAAARRRAAALDAATKRHVRFRLGDLTRIRLGRRFPLVIAPFNVFMHLYKLREFLAALATVRAHLAPRGLFVFDVRMPQPAELARDPSRWYRARPFVHPETEVRFAYKESFRYEAVSQIQYVTMAFEADARRRKGYTTLLAHRQFFPAELVSLLAAGGFMVAARFGDFRGGPLDADCESQILVAASHA